MTIHYVDFFNGNDTTGTGATGAPWKTLSKFLTSGANGDTCRARGGDVDGQRYYERNLSTSKTGLTIEPDTGHAPVFRGSTVKTSWAKTGGQTNVYETADTDASCFGVWNGATELTSTASIAACDALTNSFYFDAAGDKLYTNIGGSAPTSIDKIGVANLFLTVTGAGFTIRNIIYEYSLNGLSLQVAPVVDGLTFRRFTSNGTTRQALTIDGDGADISNCTIQFATVINAPQGIVIESTALNSSISDCEITGGYRGVRCDGGTGHTVDRTNSWSAYQDGFQCSGTAIVSDCISTNAFHIGFQSRGGGNNTFIRCVTYIEPGNPQNSTGLFGFVTENASTQGHFYHCVAANIERGTDSDPAGMYLTGTSDAVDIINCIFYECGAGIRSDAASSGTKNYNCLNGNAINYEGGSAGANDITTDPLFVDQANDNYALQSGSPCKNTGVIIAGVNDGYPDGLPDRGAYEAVSAIVPDFIASTAVVYQPTVQPGTVTITPTFIASGAVVYSPSLSSDSATIAPNFIASTAVVYQPTVSAEIATIAPNFLDSVAVVFEPTLSLGIIIIEPSMILSSEVVFEPTVFEITIVIVTPASRTFVVPA